MPLRAGSSLKTEGEEENSVETVKMKSKRPVIFSKKWLHGFRSLLVTLAAAAVFLVAAPCPDLCPAAISPDEIRVGSELEFPPYALLDKNGQPAGFSIDLIRAVADAMGLSIKISTGPWDTVWNDLVAGRIDVLPIVAKLPERAQVVDFSLPHTETFDAFFVRKGEPSIRDIEGAKGKDIVVMRSDAAHQALLERNFQGRVIPVGSIPEGLSLVASGKHDAFLCSKLIGTMAIKEHGIRGLVAGPPIPDYKRVFSFAVRKGDADLLEKLNQGLMIVKMNGQYDRIYDKWLTPGVPWRRWHKYLVPAIAVAIVIVLAAGIWLVTLQLLIKKRTRELAESNEMLRLAWEGLEEKVSQRTVELAQTNKALEAEVAERERAGNLLRSTMERFYAILSGSLNAILLVSNDDRVEFANQAFCDMFGFDDPPAQLRGLSAAQIIEKIRPVYLDPQESIARIGQIVGEGKPVRGEEVAMKDGRTCLRDFVPLRVEGQSYGRAWFHLDISERSRAEAALKESESKYRNLFENMTEEVHFWKLVRDEGGRIMTWRLVDANPPTLKTWGKTLDEIRGKTTDEIFGPGAAEHYMAIVQKIMTENVPYFFEDYFPNLDKYFRFTSVPLGDYFITTGADITTIKKAEKAIARERDFTSAVLSTVGALVVVLDTEGRIVRFNRACEHSTGYAFDEVKGVPFWDIFLIPEETEAVKAVFAELRAGQFPNEHENYWVAKDGTLRFIHWSNTALCSADGSVEYVIAAGNDVTDRRKAEEALRESREQNEFLADLIRASSQPLGIGYADGSVGLVNRAFEELTGYTGEELRSMDWATTLTPPEWREMEGEKLAELARTGLPVRYEKEYVRKDGTRVPIELFVHLRTDEKGAPQYYYSFLTDVTERRKAENALRKARDDLAIQMGERTRELHEKEVLLKEVHHRVKNNLQVISSLVGLQADGSADGTVREVLRDVTYRVRSMALVHEKLYQSADLANIDFAEYARTLLDYLWRAHGETAAPIRLTFDLEAMPLPVDIAVPCGLILNELAGNALKHAFPGRADGEVTVSLRGCADGRITFEVRDNGIGFPRDFDWRQAQSLGLRLVQLLAGQLNANVETESSAGSRFSVTFEYRDEENRGDV